MIPMPASYYESLTKILTELGEIENLATSLVYNGYIPPCIDTRPPRSVTVRDEDVRSVYMVYSIPMENILWGCMKVNDIYKLITKVEREHSKFYNLRTGLCKNMFIRDSLKCDGGNHTVTITVSIIFE